MACGPKLHGLTLFALIVAGTIACRLAVAQVPLSLAELNQRKIPGYLAVHADQVVQIRGTVNAAAFRFPTYSILTIQDQKDGAALETLGESTVLAPYHPGDEVQASGRVSQVAGMIAVVVDRVTLLAHGSPPPGPITPLGEMSGFSLLGRRVRVNGRLEQFGETVAGPYLTIAEKGERYRIFLPRLQEQDVAIEGLSVGDEIDATGVGFQYAPRAPFNRGFELLVGDASQIARTARIWFVPPVALTVGLGFIIVAILLLWRHEHRMRDQRERLRETYQLGEEIVGASSTELILKRISEALPAVLGVTRVHLYVHNRAAKTLDSVIGDGDQTLSLSLSDPPSGPQAGAVACFHYRTLLVIPDIDRSPFPIAGEAGQKTPKSLLFVPMMAQGDIVGVLELDQDDRARDFPSDEQTLAQHLGNQIGVALRLLDQRSVQEQLFRTEKLAAVGRLITGVVNELQTPLSSISDLATRGLERLSTGTPDRELAAIAAEAQKAVSMVARLVSFAAAEQTEARHVSVGNLLHNLINFREGDWKASGIRVRDLTSREPMTVLGSQGQLEQVFLTLLVHAEQALAEAPQKEITIRTGVLARRLLVEIGFSAPRGSSGPEETAAVLGVTRSVIGGHGGEVRLIEKSGADPRFEVELPLAGKERPMVLPATSGGGSVADHSRRMTALVIEPDEAAQRQLLALLSGRGYRVVPVDHADAGLELAQRLRFDAAFCSLHAPGLNWVELSERMQSRVGAFVLLSDGYDTELSADFEGQGRFVLPKPFQEAELARVLKWIERVPTAKVISIKDGVA